MDNLLKKPRCVLTNMLQFGHGGEPWITHLQVSQAALDSELQFGHGGEPWITREVAGRTSSFDDASIRPRR